MAAGGDVSFCAGPHNPDCEYFADGGVSGTEVPDDMLAPEPVSDAPASGSEVPDDMLAPADATPSSPAPVSGQEVPAENLKDYNTLGQQALTIGEGIATGIGGPVATAAELGLSKLGVPDLTAEDQAARQEQHPYEFNVAHYGTMAGSMALGVGEAGLAAKIATGSAKLDGALANGLITVGDQLSKALLGQGDPHDVVSPLLAVGSSLFLGGVLGAAGEKLGGGLKAAADSKAAAAGAEWLGGYGLASEGGELAKDASSALSAGHAAYQKQVETAGNMLGGVLGSKIAGYPGARWGEKLLGPYLQRVVGKAGSYAVPATLRWLSKGATGSISDILGYAKEVANGDSLVKDAVGGLFTAGAQAASNEVTKEHIDAVRNWVEGGGVDKDLEKQQQINNTVPHFAEGGEVKAPKTELYHDTVAATFPRENVLLNAAKGRISNYLNAARPQEHTPKLAFDDPPDNRDAKRQYDKALKIAASPLSVLNDIKAGTVEPEDIKHLNGMYPELTSHLQKKITEQITESQSADKKPAYRTRQGLSMLLGTPLSGEMVPANIQAAQAVFVPNIAQRQKPSQPQSKPKKSSNTLTKSSQAYLTGDQALQKRQQQS